MWCMPQKQQRHSILKYSIICLFASVQPISMMHLWYIGRVLCLKYSNLPPAPPPSPHSKWLENRMHTVLCAHLVAKIKTSFQFAQSWKGNNTFTGETSNMKSHKIPLIMTEGSDFVWNHLYKTRIFGHLNEKFLSPNLDQFYLCQGKF